MFYEQQDWEQAAAELEQVTSDKACPIQEAFQLAGLVALRRDDRQKAQEMFTRCVDLAPQACLASECKLAQ